MTQPENRPGLFVKGERARRADTPSEAVALQYDGYVRADEQDTESLDRATLQAQAKALGIRANQSNETLAKAIAEHDGDGVQSASTTPTPDLGEDAPVTYS